MEFLYLTSEWRDTQRGDGKKKTEIMEISGECWVYLGQKHGPRRCFKPHKIDLPRSGVCHLKILVQAVVLSVSTFGCIVPPLCILLKLCWGFSPCLVDSILSSTDGIFVYYCWWYRPLEDWHLSSSFIHNSTHCMYCTFVAAVPGVFIC